MIRAFLNIGGTDGTRTRDPCVTGRYSNRLNYRSALCSRWERRRILRIASPFVNGFFSSFESFAAKSPKSLFFSAFYRYLCPPEAGSAFFCTRSRRASCAASSSSVAKTTRNILPDAQCAELLFHLVAVVSLLPSQKPSTFDHRYRQINFRKDLGIE